MAAELGMADGRIVFQVGGMRLTFCPDTGNWLSMDKRGAPTLLGTGGLSSLCLTVGGVTAITQGRQYLQGLKDARVISAFALRDVRLSGDVFTLIRAAEGFVIYESFAWNMHKQRLERTMTVDWEGPGTPPLLRAALLRLPALYRMDGVLEAPGYPEILHQPLNKLPYGEFPLLEDKADREAPIWRPGVLAAGYDNQTLLMWAYHERIPAYLSVSRFDWGVVFAQQLPCGARVKPGAPLELGTQYVRDSDVTIEAALEGHRMFLHERGVEPLPASPVWTRDVRAYEVVIGVKPARGGVYEPYRSLDALIGDLPRIRGLGFNVIQLMPHFPYPGYAIHDMNDIATHYGPPGQVRAMVDRAHALGMRVTLDVVLHGVVDKRVMGYARFDEHPFISQHPEYFVWTEDGRIARTYTYAFDLRNDGVRDYITEAMLRYITELDVDGFRLDAPTFNVMPNWADGINYPGYECLTGAVTLFDRIRRLAAELKAGIAFICEPAGTLFGRCCDLNYNYDEQWLYAALLPVVARREVFPLRMQGGPAMDARAACEWLALAQRVTPAGYQKLRVLDSHDTHEWGGHGMFRSEMFGMQGARVLFAFAAFAGGGVLNFTGGEKGSEDFYRETLALRARVPALTGMCDFTSIRASSRDVMPILRVKGDSIAVALLHFGGRAVSVTLDFLAVTQGCVGMCALTEQYSGRVMERTCQNMRALELKLQPYAAQLWTLELPKAGYVPIEASTVST